MNRNLTAIVLADLVAVVALAVTGHPVPDALWALLIAAGGAIGGAAVPRSSATSSSSSTSSSTDTEEPTS